VGLDVAGDEAFPIDHGLAKLLSEATEDLGLGVTIHAGEIGRQSIFALPLKPVVPGELDGL